MLTSYGNDQEVIKSYQTFYIQDEFLEKIW
jgi:hypothetical protein